MYYDGTKGFDYYAPSSTPTLTLILARVWGVTPFDKGRFARVAGGCEGCVARDIMIVVDVVVCGCNPAHTCVCFCAVIVVWTCFVFFFVSFSVGYAVNCLLVGYTDVIHGSAHNDRLFARFTSHSIRHLPSPCTSLCP